MLCCPPFLLYTVIICFLVIKHLEFFPFLDFSFIVPFVTVFQECVAVFHILEASLSFRYLFSGFWFC